MHNIQLANFSFMMHFNNQQLLFYHFFSIHTVYLARLQYSV